MVRIILKDMALTKMHYNIREILQSLAVDLKSNITEELQFLGIPIVPKLKLIILQSDQNDRLVLDTEDVFRLFSYFGELISVSVNINEAIIEYKEIVHAYLAQKILNEKYLERQCISLKVNWIQSTPATKTIHRLMSEANVQESNTKFTCKFEIEIENCGEFQVSRRIIGPKGKNMKVIIEACMKDCEGTNVVKLRLRGKGSGFKEGPFNEESNEPLHLCVSSKYYDRFKIACAEAEKLILSVYAEHYNFMKKKGIENEKIVSIKTLYSNVNF